IEMFALLKEIEWIESFIVQGKNSSLIQAEENFKEKAKLALAMSDIFIKDATIFQKAILKQANTTVEMLTTIAIMSLLLGGLSILNLLLILYDERRKEVGLRLAMGATPLQISWQFLREIALLCSIGAMGGIVFGHLAAYIIVIKLGLIYHFGWFSW